MLWGHAKNKGNLSFVKVDGFAAKRRQAKSGHLFSIAWRDVAGMHFLSDQAG